MAGRPRTPINVLELRGALINNPRLRNREDLEGPSKFDPLPPDPLPLEMHATWIYIVERLPNYAVYNTDEIAIDALTRVLYEFRLPGIDKAEFRKLASILFNALGQMGMTPTARAKLGTEREDDKSKNRFARIQKRA